MKSIFNVLLFSKYEDKDKRILGFLCMERDEAISLKVLDSFSEVKKFIDSENPVDMIIFSSEMKNVVSEEEVKSFCEKKEIKFSKCSSEKPNVKIKKVNLFKTFFSWAG